MQIHEAPDIIIPLSISELRPVLLQYILHIWQVYWETIETAAFYKVIVPNVSTSIKFSDSNRSMEATITRLRFNHNSLNYNLYRTGSQVSPLCCLCQDNETAQHYFFECFRYTDLQLSCFIAHAERDIALTLSNLLGEHYVSTCIAYEYVLKSGRFRNLPGT